MSSQFVSADKMVSLFSRLPWLRFSQTTCGVCFVQSTRIVDCAVPTGSWSCSCLHIWGCNTNSRSGLISLQNIQSVQKLIIKVDVHCLYFIDCQMLTVYTYLFIYLFLIYIKKVFQLVQVCDYSHLHVFHTKTRITLSVTQVFFCHVHVWSCFGLK